MCLYLCARGSGQVKSGDIDNTVRILMLEAVNSTLANPSLFRSNTAQHGNAQSMSVNPDKIQVVAQAPYISPYIKVDVDYDTAVIQIRDADTGDVVHQIPSEPALEAARRQIAAQVSGEAVSTKTAPSPQEVKQAALQQQSPASATVTPTASSAAFGAFAQQVASLQTAMSGGKGGLVSFSA